MLSEPVPTEVDYGRDHGLRSARHQSIGSTNADRPFRNGGRRDRQSGLGRSPTNDGGHGRAGYDDAGCTSEECAAEVGALLG